MIIIRATPEWKNELQAYASSNSTTLSDAVREMTTWYMANRPSLVDDLKL